MQFPGPYLELELEESGWTMSSVEALRPDSLTAWLAPLALTTVFTVKMLESDASVSNRLRDHSQIMEFKIIL